MILNGENIPVTGKISDCEKSANFLFLIQGKEQLAFPRLPEWEHILH